MTHTEILTRALELLAVSTFYNPELQAKRTDVIEKGLEALAQPEQEPVAITNEMAFAFHSALTDGAIGEGEVEEIKTGLAAAFAHITTPPQRTWVGLTDEEIDYFIVHRLTIATKNNLVALIRICEAKFKEKNQ